ncbi:Glycosyl transferases group 1 [Rubripirellula tenax]|uniref:Glycosyl transferases group 1 n=1 Tax=Rubripirellula tenax TaxID=2528015 RepID=A0A5C6FIF5_9BACT|nr:glycosyltransferase [Rubripirellula tenax]TWU59441.1 Glycosyl transferases group 1 [Rubripirellula tenax]
MSVAPRTTTDNPLPPAATPMHVAVYMADQNPHRDRSQGITSMTRTLMDEFAVRDDLRLTQIVSSSSHRQTQPNIQTSSIPFRTDGRAGRLIADAIHPWIARPDVDLWYYPKGYAPRSVKPYHPSVGTMHDTIVQYYADHYPDSRSPRAFRYWIELTKRSLQEFSYVLTISQHAAGQLREFCDRYQITPPPIEVTYEGSSWESVRDVRYEKNECVTHLASQAPHKGTNRLLKFWETLQSRGRDLPRLELIGRLDKEGEQIATRLRNFVQHPPQPLEDLQTTIGRARALLLPSEIEGFGLPALEAYYVGTPTCYVRGTSVGEVVDERGRAGEFDLTDVDDFERSFDWALSIDEPTIRSIGDAMYDRFSNKVIAERIVAAFRRAVSV